ncbi:sialidase family protein [Propionibacteriaceae bacterium G1746]
MQHTVLAERGVGYRQYRIPAMAVTATGRVLAIHDARPDVDDLPSPIDLVVRHSDDGGLTWSPQRVLRTGTGLEGFGDPSAIGSAGLPGTPGHGRILVFHQATTTGGFFEDDAADVDLATSDDNGLTWTHRRITDQLKHPDADAVFAASGAGCLVRQGTFAGRLVQPLVERTGTTIRARLAFSDDAGETWQLGEAIEGANESSVTDLPDGRLAFSGRAAPHRLTGWSSDGGVHVDVAPDPALDDPSDNGAILQLDGTAGTPGALVCSHNHDQHLRRNLVVHRSPDGGRTWPEVAVVHEGSAGYSTMVELPGGGIGVLWEREGYQQVVFTRVDDHDFAPVARVLPAADLTGVELDLVLRLVRPPQPDLAQAAATLSIDQTEGWDPNAWRETGAARAGEASQPLFTRETYAALGGVVRGLAPDDELHYTARFRCFDGEAESVVWRFTRADGTVESGRAEAPLANGEPLLLNLASPAGHADVARVQLEVEGVVAGEPVAAMTTLTHDRATGEAAGAEDVGGDA